MSPSKGWRSKANGWRSEHVCRTSGEFLSWNDGMRIGCSECEQSHGLQTAVTTRSTFKSEWLAEVVPRSPGEVLMENKVARTYLRRAAFERWGVSEGCPECRSGKDDSKLTAKHVGEKLKADSSGSARLAAADRGS